MSRFSNSMLALAAMTALAGCNVGPKYTRPQTPAAPTYRGADNAAVTSDAKNSLGDQQWSAVFKDPELQELIKTALANNYDLKIAAMHVLEQIQQVRVTHSAEFPQITAGGTGVGAYLPDSLSSTLGSNPIADGSFDLSATWTPDFWGLYRKQTEAARDQLLSQQWAQRAVQMSLVQQVATTYFQLRELDEQLAITKQTIEVRKQSLDLTQRLERGGSAPLSDVRQAEQLLFTATSELPQLEQQIQEAENAMRLLLGETPGTVAHTDPNALNPPPQNLPVGLPSQLLERRPDIQEAEAQLKAANANVGVAKAQFFPQLSISASAGLGGDDWNNLFDPSGHTIYGLGSLAEPIFEGGKIKGQYELSKRQKDEMILTYQKTILGAFRDVSNALISANKQRAAREQQELLVASAKDSTRLARIRYQGGSTSYLEVLTTDTTLFSAELNLAAAQESEALTLVQLYASLGGGWQ